MPQDPPGFYKWYQGWAKKAGLDPNPDSPLHKYDYRAAFKAGVEPQIDASDGLYHWPSQFKADDHPNRFVRTPDGVLDSKYGKIMPQDPKKKQFDPDAYLSKFNPDAYLAGKGQQQQPAPQQERPLYKRILGHVDQPAQTLQRGVQRAQSGNIPAGGADIASAVLQSPGAAFGVGTELLGEIPTVGPFMKGGVEGLASVPPALFKGGTDMIEGLFGLERSLPTWLRALNPGLALLSEVSGNEQQLLGQSPEQYQQTRESVRGLGESASPYLAPVVGSSMTTPFRQTPSPKIGESGPSPFQQRMGKMQAYRAQKTAGAIGAGESAEGMRRAGQFASEFDIPLTSTELVGGELKPSGSLRAREVVKKLDKGLNDLIIEPATNSGSLIDGRSFLDAYRGMKDEYINSLSPNKASVAAIDRLIKATEERLSRTERPGYLTPREAQDMKVRNNKILEDFYKSVERRGGVLGPEQKVQQQALARETEVLREQIESLHPQVERINWTEGAGLEMSRAVERFQEAKLKGDPSLARGSGQTAAAAGRGYGLSLFTISELMLYRPFRYAYNKWLTKQATRFSGKPSEFIRPEQIEPFRPNLMPPDALKALPPGPLRISQPPDQSGPVQGEPFIHYGVVDPKTPKALPRGPIRPDDPLMRGAQEVRVSTGNIGDIIPSFFRNTLIRKLGGPETQTKFGPLRMVSDRDLITLAKEAGLYENAPISEAPVSRGGSMDVRGPANQEQLRRFKK